MDTTVNRWLTALFQHSERWGMLWFGLIFWGSVINALGLKLMPGADPALLAWAAYATGLAIGAFAKARGGWL
ncbi:MAG: hypothetical protein AAGE43_18395 [Pseudomonadota bacterium]